MCGFVETCMMEGAFLTLKEPFEGYARPAFGFAGITPEKWDKTIWHYGTGLQVLGYLPIIGQVVGVVRIVFSAITFHVQTFPNDPSGIKDSYRLKMQLLRGCLELSGLGIALLVIDVAVACFRRYAPYQYQVLNTINRFLGDYNEIEKAFEAREQQ